MCDKCEDNIKIGHKYCRRCGEAFPVNRHHAPVAIAYDVQDKFCGYCRGPKHECDCTKN
jgi:hypothetical protein